MKKNKPVKIKRYRRSFSGSGDRNNLLRRILLWVLILAVIFGLGMAGGKTRAGLCVLALVQL